MTSSKELPKEINQKIQEEAKYHSEGKNYDSVRYTSYFTGATAWAKIAIGFAIWASDNYWLKKLEHGTTWVQIIPDENREERARRLPKTTSDLLIEYIKTLTQ